MKVKKVTFQRKPFGLAGFLTNICPEGSLLQGTSDVRVGSSVCHICPLHWFRIGGFVVCHKVCHKNREKPMHKDFERYISAAIRLNIKCSEVQMICCKVDRFGLDDWNPDAPVIKTNRVWLEEELTNLENAIINMREYVRSIPNGTQRYRKDGVKYG